MPSRLLHPRFRSGPKPLRVPRAALVWALVPVLVLLVVWQQASVDRLGVRLEKEKDRARQLQSQVNALSLEANRLSSLGQVESRATRELGLVRPSTDQIVDLVFTPGDHDGRPRFGSLVTEANAGTRTPGNPR